jgi:cell division protein FtsW (lipid II flippase)
VRFIFPSSATVKSHVQTRLMYMAGVFLFIYSLVLTLSPAVRQHSWNVEYRWQHWIGFFSWLILFAFFFRQASYRLPDQDPYLLPIAALLSGWGLLTIWRLDATFGLRQTFWLAICLLVLFGVMRVSRSLSLLRRYKYLWLTGGLLLTALTFLFGTYPGGEGPHLWLGCCGMYFQPSEPLKLLLVVYLAAYLADSLPISFSFLHLLAPTLVLIGAALAILVAQRDLGTASLFLMLYFIIVYLGSGKRRILVIASAVILTAGFTGYQLFDVIRLRVQAWVNPWLDPAGRSYQIVQSILAVAAGGLIGSGPGIGNPGVVPVAHSDFIFASIAEETGLLGTAALLLLVGLLASRGLTIALRASNRYQRYLAAGLTVYLTLQSLLIVGGNLRIVPLTGVTMPFVSYGGSSLLTSFLSVMILILISDQPNDEPASLSNPKPYFVASAALLAALVVVILVDGWWGFVRSDSLLSRADNPRWFISDRYSPRGNLLDRHNQPILMTTGVSGNYSRSLQHIALGSIVGYSHPLYGQSGLEAGLDSYLRAVQGTPASDVWFSEMLYSQRPAGLDVRLSIDMRLQTIADSLLGEKTGALVLLNARTGEVLAIASHPYYDPQKIDTEWSQWIQDKKSRLLNRATQGQYPPGAALGPFLLAWDASSTGIPAMPQKLSVNFQSRLWECARPTTGDVTWGSAVQNGCPAAALQLGSRLTVPDLVKLYESLGFGTAPSLPLPVATVSDIQTFDSRDMAAIGQEKVSVSPMQMALAAAILSSDGNRPMPVIATAVETPLQGWIVLPTGSPVETLPPNSIQRTTDLLAVKDQPIWQTVANAHAGESLLSWYIGGTMPDWQGTQLALALVLEDGTPAEAESIGQKLLITTMQP